MVRRTTSYDLQEVCSRWLNLEASDHPINIADMELQLCHCLMDRSQQRQTALCCFASRCTDIAEA